MLTSRLLLFEIHSSWDLLTRTPSSILLAYPIYILSMIFGQLIGSLQEEESQRFLSSHCANLLDHAYEGQHLAPCQQMPILKARQVSTRRYKYDFVVTSRREPIQALKVHCQYCSRSMVSEILSRSLLGVLTSLSSWVAWRIPISGGKRGGIEGSPPLAVERLRIEQKSQISFFWHSSNNHFSDSLNIWKLLRRWFLIVAAACLCPA